MRSKNNWTSFKDLQGFVSLILLVDWDPIRIFGYAGATDEYDSYVEGICNLLRSGSSAETLNAHLYHLETKQMEMTTSESRRAEVARKLAFVYRVIEEERRQLAEFLAHEEAKK